MERHVSIALVAALVLWVTVLDRVGHCQDSVQVTSTPSYYRFIGFSNGTITGMEGHAKMNIKCKAQFGGTARMGTTEEIQTSDNLPNGKDKVGWIKPAQIQVSALSEPMNTARYFAVDIASGRVEIGVTPHKASARLNCWGWTFGSGYELLTGTVLDGTTGNVLVLLKPAKRIEVSV